MALIRGRPFYLYSLPTVLLRVDLWSSVWVDLVIYPFVRHARSHLGPVAARAVKIAVVTVARGHAALPCKVDWTCTVDATSSGCLNQSGAERSSNKELCHRPLRAPIRFMIRARHCRGSLYDSVLLLPVARTPRKTPIDGTPVEDARRRHGSLICADHLCIFAKR